MTDVLTNFFGAISGTGNEHAFVLFVLSIFVSGVISLFLIEPVT